MKSKLKIGLIAVLAFILTGTVVADLILTKQISTSMNVKPVLSMDIYDIDGKTPLTSITLGQFSWESEFYFPGHLVSAPSAYYYVNNTDQQSFYVGFEVASNYPAGTVGFVFYIKRGDQASFTMLMGAMYQHPIETELVNPDPQTQYAVWYFKVWVAKPPFGTYSPMIKVHAYDAYVSG